MREHDLQAQVVRIQRRVRKLRAVVRLLVASLHLLGIDLSQRRLPDGEELAIKDARWPRLNARRRPHISPTDNLRILEPKAARG